MAKLTLSVDDDVINAAKRYAKERGLSISQMVETYLSSVVDVSPGVSGGTPILRSVRGTLKNAALKDYRKHLANKYQ